MKSLWVITGFEPVTWSIPFWVTFYPGLKAELLCAMALTEYQQAAVNHRIGAAAASGARIALSQLNRVGRKIHDKDRLPHPEQHFVWERPRLFFAADKGKVGAPNKRRARVEFIHDLYLRGIGQSESELEFWWNQFCNQMVWHLINRETPIDLYFCKLHPSPYRVGWQAQLARQEITRPVPRRLMNPRLLASNGGRGVMRNIDLEVMPLWTKLSRRVEINRLNLLGQWDYAAEFMAMVERRAICSARLYCEWLRFNRVKHPWLTKSNDGKRFRFTGIYDSARAITDTRIVDPEFERKARAKEELHRIQIKKARHMRQMLALQRKAKNLRYARGFIRRTAHGEVPSNGLPMLHADQVGPDARHLLAEGPGAERWLV